MVSQDILDYIESLFQQRLRDFRLDTVEGQPRFMDWERAGVLFDEGLIPTQQGNYSEILVKENEETVFEMKWAIFDNVCYINWIRISEEYRKEGLTSSIRKRVVDWMFAQGCREVFTIPSSDAGRELIKSQGFSKTKVQPQENYTIYSLDAG